MLSRYGERLLVKSPNNGLPELRRALAAYLARSRGIFVQPAQIVIGSGAEYLYSLLAQLFRGAAFALEKADAEYKMIGSGFEKEINEGEYSLVVVSPGIALSDPLFEAAKKRGIPVISEIELGYTINRGKILAVTGTNGKTTVAKMAALMLGEKYRVALCGNVGMSFSSLAAVGGYEIAVVEVSSFQLETVFSFKPDVAVITNVSEDHIDRHGSMERYVALKLKIAKNMRKTNK